MECAPFRCSPLFPAFFAQPPGDLRSVREMIGVQNLRQVKNAGAHGCTERTLWKVGLIKFFDEEIAVLDAEQIVAALFFFFHDLPDRPFSFLCQLSLFDCYRGIVRLHPVRR